jgi:hypothetical protein
MATARWTYIYLIRLLKNDELVSVHTKLYEANFWAETVGKEFGGKPKLKLSKMKDGWGKKREMKCYWEEDVGRNRAKSPDEE